MCLCIFCNNSERVHHLKNTNHFDNPYFVHSDVNSLYLSSSAPQAAAEWTNLLRPLRGREPEGIWNLLSIVREMYRRRDTNAISLLKILTEECIMCDQVSGVH